MGNTSSSQALLEFLRWEHAKEYIGVDDDMSDDFDRYVSNMTEEDLCRIVLDVFRSGI